jgi:hypothetical protein
MTEPQMNLIHQLLPSGLAEIESHFRNELLICQVHRQCAAEGGTDSPYWTGQALMAVKSMQWFGIDATEHATWADSEARAMMRDGRYREVVDA